MPLADPTGIAEWRKEQKGKRTLKHRKWQTEKKKNIYIFLIRSWTCSNIKMESVYSSFYSQPFICFSNKKRAKWILFSWWCFFTIYTINTLPSSDCVNFLFLLIHKLAWPKKKQSATTATMTNRAQQIIIIYMTLKLWLIFFAGLLNGIFRFYIVCCSFVFFFFKSKLT